MFQSSAGRFETDRAAPGHCRQRIVAAAASFVSRERADPDSDVDVLRAWVRLEAVAKAGGPGIGVLLTEEGVIGGAAGSRQS